MDTGLIQLLVMIGVPFCIAGGLVAFLTTYAGYTRGQNPDKRLAMRMALQTGLVVLVALVILVIAIAFVLADIVLK